MYIHMCACNIHTYMYIISPQNAVGLKAARVSFRVWKYGKTWYNNLGSCYISGSHVAKRTYIS